MEDLWPIENWFLRIPEGAKNEQVRVRHLQDESHVGEQVFRLQLPESREVVVPLVGLPEVDHPDVDVGTFRQDDDAAGSLLHRRRLRDRRRRRPDKK